MYPRQVHGIRSLPLRHLPGGGVDDSAFAIATTTMRQHGWIQDPQTTDTKRFHRDEKSWPRDPRVFVDSGRPLPGEPPLLKTRVHLRKETAEQLWRELQRVGWKVVTPQWGADADV